MMLHLAPLSGREFLRGSSWKVRMIGLLFLLFSAPRSPCLLGPCSQYRKARKSSSGVSPRRRAAEAPYFQSICTMRAPASWPFVPKAVQPDPAMSSNRTIRLLPLSAALLASVKSRRLFVNGNSPRHQEDSRSLNERWHLPQEHGPNQGC